MLFSINETVMNTHILSRITMSIAQWWERETLNNIFISAMSTFVRLCGSPRILHKCKFTVFYSKACNCFINYHWTRCTRPTRWQSEHFTIICCCFCNFFIKVLYMVSTLVQLYVCEYVFAPLNQLSAFPMQIERNNMKSD